MYCRNIKKTFEELEERIEETEEENLIIGGDLNAKMGAKGGPIWDESQEIRRRSKDKVINREGRELLVRLEDRRWAILNGSIGDEGDTYVRENGASIIEYVVVNEKAVEKIF